MEKNIRQILELFLSSNNIIFNKEELRLQLLSHPHFPSVNAITDLFDHFKIENIAAEVPSEIAIISELPNSFLAHIKEDGVEKIVLVIKKSDSLKLVYGAKESKQFTYEAFVACWTGIVVAIEKEETETKSNLNTSSFFKTASYVLFAIVMIALLIRNPLPFFGFNYLFITGIGLLTSVLLVQKELGLHSQSLNKFCESSSTSSCDDVLNSKGALLFGLFKLSDVGLVYFSSISLTILICSITGAAINYSLFYLLSLASALFIPYSIYYQWRVVKKWCPLCLIVLGVLLSQTILLAFFVPSYFTLHIPTLLAAAFSLLFVGLLWSALKPGLKKAQEFEKLQLEHYKFKRNSSLFTTALKSSDKKEMAIAGIEEIVLGNKNAGLKIVLVTNPRCFYCKEAHHIYHEVLKTRKDNIQLIIRFNINTSNRESNLGLEISNQLLEIYTNRSEEDTLQALDEIYSDMEPEAWLQKWKSTSFLNHVSELEKAKEWCTDNAVNFTPAVFINGYLFPKEYNKKDISYFIDHLIEEEI